MFRCSILVHYSPRYNKIVVSVHSKYLNRVNNSILSFGTKQLNDMATLQSMKDVTSQVSRESAIASTLLPKTSNKFAPTTGKHVWYEECMLRYSNHSISATEEELPWRYWCSVNNFQTKTNLMRAY